MTHVQVAATFSSALHPRVPAGQSGGGRFGSGGSKPPAKKAPAPKSRRAHRRRVIPKGQLGFDGVHGTGYGMPYGDPRVRSLQTQLNRLGLLDMHGRELAVDGKLGPLTTSSIRAAQRRLGMRATGIVDPAFIDRLKATKALPPAKKKAPGRGRQTVKAKFDPSELRDADGTWTHSPVGAVKDAVKLVEEFAGGRGTVSALDDGSFDIHLNDGGRAQLRVHLSGGDDAAELRSALQDGRDASGNGWRLSVDADGVDLSGGSHDDNGVRLSHDDADSLDGALREIEARDQLGGLTAVAPLRAGEALVGKKKFGGADQPVGVAVVDAPEGRTVRLAPIGWLDDSGIPGRELKNYTGGRGESSAVLDEQAAGRLSGALSSLAGDAESRRKAIQKALDRYDKDGDDAALAAAVKPYEIPGGDGALDGHFGPMQEIDTPWGTVVAQGYSDEQGEWHIDLGVRPDGAVQGEDWSLDGYKPGSSLALTTLAQENGNELPVAALEAKDVRALAKYLSTAFSEQPPPSCAVSNSPGPSRGSFPPEHRRSPRRTCTTRPATPTGPAPAPRT
jgi:hypothetical protein